MICHNLPENIEDDNIEQIEDKCWLAILFTEVVSHSVSLFYQNSLQTFLAKTKVFQSLECISSLRLPTFSIIENETKLLAQHSKLVHKVLRSPNRMVLVEYLLADLIIIDNHCWPVAQVNSNLFRKLFETLLQSI